MVRKYSEKQYNEDRKIIEYIERTGVNLQDISKDVNCKIYVLENICNYHGLRVGPNGNSPFLPINQCSDGKISETVRDRYNRAKKRLEEYNKGKRKITHLEGKVEQLSLF